MYELAINPSSGNLQIIDKKNITSIQVSENTECKSNNIYISNREKNITFLLPTIANEGDWIKIFGKSNGGWSLYIPESVQVIAPSGMRVINSKYYFHSNMHQFDFIHLIFISNSWYIENKSETIGISKNE